MLRAALISKVFAPCAPSGILNAKTIPQLKCKAIAGLAYNQLETLEDGQALLTRGIAYAPDFVVDSGGVIRATQPIFDTPNLISARAKIVALNSTIAEILRRSEAENTPTQTIAEAITQDLINAAG